MLVPERNQHFERREAMTSLRPVAQDVSTMFKMVFDASTRQMETRFLRSARRPARRLTSTHARYASSSSITLRRTPRSLQTAHTRGSYRDGLPRQVRIAFALRSASRRVSMLMRASNGIGLVATKRRFALARGRLVTRRSSDGCNRIVSAPTVPRGGRRSSTPRSGDGARACDGVRKWIEPVDVD